MSYELVEKMGLNYREETAYSEGRTEHLLFHNLFPHTVQVSPLLVHSVLQPVHHLLFVPPVSLYKIDQTDDEPVLPTFNNQASPYHNTHVPLELKSTFIRSSSF